MPASPRSEALEQLLSSPDWTATRVKSVRQEPLQAGGRARLTLFEAADHTGRPHPRLQVSVPPVEDPVALESYFVAPELGPSPSAEAAVAALREGFAAAKAKIEASLSAEALEPLIQSPRSRRYVENNLYAQRTARWLSAAAAWAHNAGLTDALRYPLAVLRDEAYAREVQFDNEDTGTYHSYKDDKPFVHYLETLLASLPEDGSDAMASLSAVQQSAVRRQRVQAQAHLDFLMRHKYAHSGIKETDIERSLGGRLIDRRTRQVVSETVSSAGRALPEYELLRIDPTAAHPHAGAYVHRAGALLRLDDGTEVSAEDSVLRRIPIEPARLTFERMPGDPRLRAGVRLDWDGGGHIQPGKVGWVSWAGHCDIKAVMEQLGITLTKEASTASVTEYRADTGATTVYNRDLLLEMVASAMELGSVYARLDGSGRVHRGISHFGGSRNDSRPDRLQLQGISEGGSLRWPLSQRADTLVVTALSVDGETVDLDRAFHRWVPDADALDFSPNPLFKKTIEGDVSLLDVSGAVLDYTFQEDIFDDSGYPVRQPLEVHLDLGRTEGRTYLGAQLRNAADRERWLVWLDHGARSVEAKVVRTVRDGDGWTEQPVPEATVVLPLSSPGVATLSREMKRDDPAQFRTLVETALRTGQNICADTDMAAEVWNGVVTKLHARKVKEDTERRVEQWSVSMRARFGSATLEYLVRRGASGEPDAWCPLRGESATDEQPDFLWQDFPDVGSKGRVQGAWVVNQAMRSRGIVTVEHRPSMPGAAYVHDDHIKNVYELIHCGLGGRPFTLVVDNKRWAVASEAEWKRHIGLLVAAGVSGGGPEQAPAMA